MAESSPGVNLAQPSTAAQEDVYVGRMGEKKTLTSVEVPPAFTDAFAAAESHVSELFEAFERRPEEGVVRVGGERYVLMRCESLYGAWFEALEASFGPKPAKEFIYNTAREIGRSDCRAFSARLNLTDGVERLSSGPVHFSHAGWAFVQILEDSTPTNDDSFFLHYVHPNTFESEVLKKRGVTPKHVACHFSAGYSAGWCSEAFNVEVHGRELHCVAVGDARCEFIMATASKLDEHEARLMRR